jgi:hypothetical protein
MVFKTINMACFFLQVNIGGMHTCDGSCKYLIVSAAYIRTTKYSNFVTPRFALLPTTVAFVAFDNNSQQIAQESTDILDALSHKKFRYCHIANDTIITQIL